MVRPKKYLGQHFLTDRRIAQKIVAALEPEKVDGIIEIGPGKGILSRFLLPMSGKKLFFVEIDSESRDYLLNEFPEIEGSLVCQDFLKLELDYFGSRLGIIGNLPYNISSQIFFHVLDYRESVEQMVCMIQREVAERIVSPPGSKRYGILSVLLQTWYSVRTVLHVNPGSFFPAPEVKSTVIKLERNGRGELDFDPSFYYKIVKTAFNQRRKILRNSLRSIILNFDDIPFLEKRPEELSVDEFIHLALAVYKGRMSAST